VQPERTSLPARPSPGSSSRPSLTSMQTAVMAFVTGRDAGVVIPGPGALIVSDARASAGERMHVYAHMYRARIAEALESQFPRLAKLLGSDAFADLAAAYITDEPSRHPSLRHVGERLPAWLAARRREAPRLAALARLEWARADVFDLADDPPLTLDALRAWPPDRFGELPLRLLTAHRLLTVPAGTAEFWDSLGSDHVTAADAEASAGIAEGGDESLIVWREGTIVYHRPVTPAEHTALEHAAVGTYFGVICESVLATQSEEAALAQAYTWMSTWLADGLVRALESE
jgi:hypothetical protein